MSDYLNDRCIDIWEGCHWKPLEFYTNYKDEQHGPHELGDHCSAQTSDGYYTIDQFASVDCSDDATQNAERHNN